MEWPPEWSRWRRLPICLPASQGWLVRPLSRFERVLFHPFTGPIKNQAGEGVVAAGKVADDGMLAGMNFYVQGIDDKLPE
ncbi:MAG: hypothetical protein CM1200mP20_15330 [Pseudomonadota bacterium]|nr:MAG: hypothetical protein CM1200mP20_15330 [Pseudomonadota bacterium]